MRIFIECLSRKLNWTDCSKELHRTIIHCRIELNWPNYSVIIKAEEICFLLLRIETEVHEMKFSRKWKIPGRYLLLLEQITETYFNSWVGHVWGWAFSGRLGWTNGKKMIDTRRWSWTGNRIFITGNRIILPGPTLFEAQQIKVPKSISLFGVYLTVLLLPETLTSDSLEWKTFYSIDQCFLRI